MNALIIYHANCMDGFGAAWAAVTNIKHNLYKDGIELFPAAYGKEPPWDKISFSTDVYILDFSYPETTMRALAAMSRTVTLLDHHKTAQETLEALRVEKPENLHIYFDMKRSGAMLAWDFFSPICSKVPELIKHIQDRDLWKFELPGTREIHEYASMVPKTIICWDAMAKDLENHKDDIIEMGKLLLDKFDEQCEAILKQCKEEIEICGHKGLGCNANGMFASEIGNLLAKECGTFGATWFKESSGAIKWSLRSIGDYDVSAIAKQFGGGGHKNAAGFTIYPESGETQAGIKLWRTEE